MSVNSQSVSFGGDCYFKLPHNEFSVYTSFTYSDGMILFKDEGVQPISISSISEVVLEGSNAIFKGTFFQDSKIIYSIEMYFYQTLLLEKILKIIDKSVELASGKFILTNNETYKEFEVEIKKKDGKISILDTSAHKTYVILDKSDPLFVSENVLLFFNKQGHAYYLIFEKKKIPLDLSEFNLIKNTYYYAYCQVYGSLNHVRFNGGEVNILLNDESMYVFVDYHEHYSFSYNQLKVCTEHSDGSATYEFTSSTGDLSYITFSKNLDALNSHKLSDSYQNRQIICVDHEPYMVSCENDAWSFYQSKENKFTIKLDQLNDIEIIDNSNSERVQIAFHTGLVQGKFKYYVHESFLPELYKKTFIGKKVGLLKEASITDLYTSYTRQINDFLLFSLFGQLVFLQAEIEKAFERKGITRNQKNRQILNFMYDSLKEQRRVLDRIALQFPEMLLAEDQLFFEVNSDQPYGQLQSQLLSLSGQIQRNLSEIKNSLNQLSFAIIPRKKISIKQADKSTNAKYWGAAAMVGLGAVTGGFLPLLAGSFMGINTYFSSKDKDLKQQYTEENEDYKIDFHINRALESFEHLMETMLPYYISQVSKAYFNHSNMQLVQLLKVSDINKSTVKDTMLKRLAELYVIKKMPMEQGNLLTRENIMERLMTPKVDKKRLLITLTE